MLGLPSSLGLLSSPGARGVGRQALYSCRSVGLEETRRACGPGCAGNVCGVFSPMHSSFPLLFFPPRNLNCGKSLRERYVMISGLDRIN